MAKEKKTEQANLGNKLGSSEGGLLSGVPVEHAKQSHIVVFEEGEVAAMSILPTKLTHATPTG